jgi:hypothetical protein
VKYHGRAMRKDRDGRKDLGGDPGQSAITMRRTARLGKATKSKGDSTKMVHDTPARKRARELKEEAHSLIKDARTLEGIGGLKAESTARQDRAKELKEEAEELQNRARLEDLSVRQVDYWKDTKRKGRQNYSRWVCSWQEGNKVITKYLGSSRKLTREEALQKARAMKAEALAIEF